MTFYRFLVELALRIGGQGMIISCKFKYKGYTKNMGRNHYDACHLHCPKNNNGPVNFQVLIGNPPECPRCGQIVLEEEPIKINGEKEQGRRPLKITSNSAEKR